MRRTVAIGISPQSDVPLTIGWRRPKILLPTDCDRWMESKRRVVLVHELAHVARHDVAWQVVARLACAVYWFHPLAWLAARRMRVERELACDDAVLRCGARPDQYATVLLDVAAAVCRPRPTAAAVAMACRNSLERRIRAILEPGLSRLPVGPRTGRFLLLGAMLVVVWTAALHPFAAPRRLMADSPKSAPSAGKPGASTKNDEAAARTAGKPAAKSAADANADTWKPGQTLDLAQVRSVTYDLRVHQGRWQDRREETCKVYLERDRVRVERPGRGISIEDFREGKSLEMEPESKKATIRDVPKDSQGQMVPCGKLLTNLIKMKDAPAERLPDENIGDTPCRVYRVKNSVIMGDKCLYVKLWLDPRSNLPVQLHSVDGEMAVTFTNLHWDEPLDEDLFRLAPPKGYYVLVEEKETGKTHKAVSMTHKAVSMQVAVAALDAADGVHADRGREIQGDEVPKILDMLGRWIDANYRAIVSWSGTYELEEPTSRPTRAVVEFYVEPGRDRVRTDYREIKSSPPPRETAPPPHRDKSTQIPMPSFPPPPFYSEPREWRFVRTAEHSIEFPVNELRDHVEGFAPAAAGNPGQPFRILYRDGPEAVHPYGNRGTFIDPRYFIRDDGGLSYGETCSWWASAAPRRTWRRFRLCEKERRSSRTSQGNGHRVRFLHPLPPLRLERRRVFIGDRFQRRLHADI